MSYDSGKGHGQEYGFITPQSPLPLKRIKVKEIVNPCSGRYEGQEKGVEVEIMVDIDKTTRYATALNMVSGTMSARYPQWHVKATSLHFKAISHGFHVSGGKSKNIDVKSDVKVVFSDGTKAGGTMELKLSLDSAATTWKASFVLDITGQRKLSIENIERKSLFFKDIKLDVYFTEKLTWPTVELLNLAEAPPGMKDRELDPCSAFEDAGLKLLVDLENSQQVEDPMPLTPWTKFDLYEVMTEYFIKEKTSENDIWCMMGTTPPDKRCVGFSFGKDRQRGFGLFIGHKSFGNLEHENARKKAQAQRRLLHYLVQECGHCLGLKHSFKIGASGSLSWMNYAWRYDIRHGPASFDRAFNFSFSDAELMILRHAPGKAFEKASSSAVLSVAIGNGYNIKSDVPDKILTDDDNDVESDVYGGTEQKFDKPRSIRRIALDLKVPSQYSRGQVLSFEARLKNQGKLPALIEGDLSIEAGNLRVYITTPDRDVQAVEPCVRPIYSGYSKPKVLYTPEDKEGSDRYSQQVLVGAGSDGHIMDKAGQYEIRAVYNGGRYNVTSASYSITVVDDNDEDKETSEEVLTAATLQSSSSKRFKKSFEFWKKQKSHNVKKKKSTVATLITLLEEMADKSGRYAGGSSEHERRGLKKLSVAAAKPALSREQLLKDTDDLVKLYQEKGTKEDNFDYTRLVVTRGKLYTKEKKTEDGAKEFAQLVFDITHRGVKQDIVKQVARKWKKLVNPPKVEERYTPENLQNKVNSVLRWAPTTYGNGEPDLSGIGLGNPFRNFNHKHIKKARKIIDILFNKYDETQDIYATVSYADKLQKGREVNNMVLGFALEAFIVHSVDAKKAGIRYPEPEDMDKSFQVRSAVVGLERKGIPDEQWMNYWRCDADFNYHHKHWHVVYHLFGEHNPTEAVKVNPWLGQEGELFGYMHEQLVARYDAERESWGLKPVQSWQYDEKAASSDPGAEFDSDKNYTIFLPRPNTVWPQKDRDLFRVWERAYKTAVAEGKIVAEGKVREMTSNLAGHILEPSSKTYTDRFGAIHNDGHDTFGSIGMPKDKMSCMGSTTTAARDFIFYQWHKRMDNLLQEVNDKFETDIISDAPLVTITADDIILSTDLKPPAGFETWNNSLTQSVTCLKTYLGPPTKKFELDNKLSHERFYYHLRLKRNPTSAKKGPLPLTIRIFICPKKRQAERTRWIEMDKFVCKIEANQDSIALTRADVHSSVIKRNPKDGEDDFESKFSTTVPGFCECGWPYSMLLPRGKKDGEDYVLFAMATDNNVDNIGVNTHCGSMSYCGANDRKYPDARSMGYPFSSPIIIDDEKMPIPQVFDRISNAAYKTFKIQNDVAEPSPMKGIDVWWPTVQLGVDDGTVWDETKLEKVGVTNFIKSNLTGNFRVLIDDRAIGKQKTPDIMIRFQGRGPGGGSYVIRDVQIALRDGQTDKVKSPQTQITHHGQKTFIIPEVGLISDAVPFRLDPALGDYFVDFALDTPGVYLPARQDAHSTSTYYRPFSSRVIPWRKYADILCISGIMAAEE